MIRHTGLSNASTMRNPRSQWAATGPMCVRVPRSAYTLIELLITISIIGIMASMILFALFSAQEQAKVQKTRALITRLDSILQTRYESYRTRRVPITYDPMVDTLPIRAKMKVDAIRDLMRMEMPERWSDIIDTPLAPIERPSAMSKIATPSATQGYRRRWSAVTGQTGTLTLDTTKDEHQGAECLYMIVMDAVAQEGDARDAFRMDQIGDVDKDGFSEFIDAWGQPIRFLRWAPGFMSDKQIVRTVQLKSGDTVTPGTGSVEIKVSNTAGFNAQVQGVVAVIPSGSDVVNWDRTCTITGYSYDAASQTATITCGVPSYTGQQPFGGSPPANTDQIVLLAPDPMDSANVYPIYSAGGSPPSPDTSVPTFALYPLVYSSGPDRCFGVRTEPVTTAPLRYGSNATRLIPYTREGTKMIGCQEDFPAEQYYSSGGWLDNIHNHALSIR